MLQPCVATLLTAFLQSAKEIAIQAKRSPHKRNRNMSDLVAKPVNPTDPIPNEAPVAAKGGDVVASSGKHAFSFLLLFTHKENIAAQQY